MNFYNYYSSEREDILQMELQNQQQLVMKEACQKRFEPVVEAIKALLDSDANPILVAIDGRCASGKTTLGYYLQNMFDCNLFHMDDFFLQNEQRTKERMVEIGGNVDYERFKEEVLDVILQEKPVFYRPFLCKTKTIQPGTSYPVKRLNIIEGSYSQHAYFGNCYQLSVFTEIPEEMQQERIRQRNGEEMLQKFIAEWIPKEEAYFEAFQIREKSTIHI